MALVILLLILFIIYAWKSKYYKEIFEELANDNNQKLIQFSIGIIGLAGVLLAYQAFQDSAKESEKSAKVLDTLSTIQIFELVKQSKIVWDIRLYQPYYIGDPSSYNLLLDTKKEAEQQNNYKLLNFINTQLSIIENSYTAVTPDITNFKNNKNYGKFCLDGIPGIGTACEEKILSDTLIDHSKNIRNSLISCSKAIQLMPICEDNQKNALGIAETLIEHIEKTPSLVIKKIALDSFEKLMRNNGIDYKKDGIFDFEDTLIFYKDKKIKEKLGKKK
jgi:hypothetical protein